LHQLAAHDSAGAPTANTSIFYPNQHFF